MVKEQIIIFKRIVGNFLFYLDVYTSFECRFDHSEYFPILNNSHCPRRLRFSQFVILNVYASCANGCPFSMNRESQMATHHRCNVQFHRTLFGSNEYPSENDRFMLVTFWFLPAFTWAVLFSGANTLLTERRQAHWQGLEEQVFPWTAYWRIDF